MYCLTIDKQAPKHLRLGLLHRLESHCHALEKLKRKVELAQGEEMRD